VNLGSLLTHTKAAALGVRSPIVAGLAGSGKDISGGMIDVDRRQYTFRFAGKYLVNNLDSLILE